MTHLLDVLNSHKEQQSFTGCRVAKWLDTLTEEEGQAFLDCLNAPNTSALSLYNTLISNGVDLPFKQTSFRSHVNGYCTCQR